MRRSVAMLSQLPHELLALAGCRVHPVAGRCVAHSIDADAADSVVCRWMRELLVAAAIARGATSGAGDDSGLIGVAMDGKLAGARRCRGSEVRLFSAMRHAENSIGCIVGLTPAAYSSGSSRARGPITKTGNGQNLG